MGVVLLSLDAEEVCGVCRVKPPDYDVLRCDTCACDWHMKCLQPPLTAVPQGDWSCPDCSGDSGSVPTGVGSAHHGLVKQIKEIENDKKLTPQQKARKRQLLMSNGVVPDVKDDVDDQQLLCLFCRNRLDRPVTTPCGHNFCLPCLKKAFVKCGKKCSKCRAPLSAKFMEQPRINLVLVSALRMAKVAANGFSAPSSSKPVHVIRDQDRPDKAFTTERAVRNGRANAASGKMMVETPPVHFGPITAEHDVTRGQGVLVGESWADRMDCRQWGTHLAHVAGISGGGRVGARSVALSGGYVDDEDHGEWFLYTGSGGRDLSGNKRTNSKHSSEQVFKKGNLALVTSCLNGYPVRVVRSHKEKTSSYAPEEGVRYDGIYRIEKCWRKAGAQKFLVCRYLFVRCDNEPAPWTSDTIGDRPRLLLPNIAHELKGAIDVKERKEAPAWDWKEEEGVWGWTRPPPVGNNPTSRGKRNKLKSFERELKTKFRCGICKSVLQLPVSTPCGHSYCKDCLVGCFGQSDIRVRGGVRRLRVQKVIKRCPGCKADITEFMSNPAVNKEMDQIILSLKKAMDTSAAEVERELADEKEGNEEEVNEEGNDDDGDTDEERETEEASGEEANEEDNETNNPAMQTESVDNSSRKASVVADTVDKSELFTPKVVNAAEECPAACSKVCAEGRRKDSKEVNSPKRKQAESPFSSGGGRRIKRKRGEQMLIPEDVNMEAGVEVIKEATEKQSVGEVTEAQVEQDASDTVEFGRDGERLKGKADDRKGAAAEEEVDSGNGKKEPARKKATREFGRRKGKLKAKADDSAVVGEKRSVEEEVASETAKVDKKEPATRTRKNTRANIAKEVVKKRTLEKETVEVDKEEPATRARKRTRGNFTRKEEATQGKLKKKDDSEDFEVRRKYLLRSRLPAKPTTRQGEPVVIVLDDE